MKQNQKTTSNGLYFVYTDGTYAPFTKDAKPEKEVRYIGIIHDGHPFCVALKDLGRYALLTDEGTERCEAESPFYVREECEALNDWDCIERTTRIIAKGTDIPLKENEHIPALPMLVAMRYWRKRGLDDALVAAGGKPLKDSFYWSATEYSSSNAWYVYFNSGNVYNGHKCNGYVVRPVAAFNHERSEYLSPCGCLLEQPSFTEGRKAARKNDRFSNIIDLANKSVCLSTSTVH